MNRIQIKHENCNVCVYGATASGIMAAVAVAKAGHSVILIEPSRWLGGMIGGGIRLTTDCEHPLHCGGLTGKLLLHERTLRVWDEDKGQHDLRKMWNQLIHQFQIPVYYEHRLQTVSRTGEQIDSLILEYAPSDPEGVPAPQALQEEALTISAEVFIDASYEGDLLRLSGVSYITGREGKNQYGESLAGIRNVRLFPGVDLSGLSTEQAGGMFSFLHEEDLMQEGEASRFMIPFNFRYVRTLQRSQEGRIAPAPQGIAAEHLKLVKSIHQVGHLGSCKGNYNRRSLVDGSLPGLHADYPDGSWEQRSKIWRTFIEHDRLVAQVSGIKLRLLDEMYPDTHGWPHQLYIRMARRMIGSYVMTQADIACQTTLEDPIGMGYYNVDIYPCRLGITREGVLASEGETWELVSPGPYPIAYRSLTPQREQCTNLLVSVCISSSHVACASIRMEPTFMIMGESAGIAASLAVERKVAVQDLDYQELRQRLLAAAQILAWDGKGYGARWFNKPFEAWWQKHPEEYQARPVQEQPESISMV